MPLFHKQWFLWMEDLSKSCEFVNVAGRKLYKDIQYTIPADMFYDGSMNLNSLHYTNLKVRQLVRTYYNQDSIDRAIKNIKHRVQKRAFGSTQIAHQNEVKKNVLTDFCMISTVISYVPQHKCSYVHVFWRSMEAIKRGPADFIFLRDHVLPKFKFVFDSLPIKEFKFFITSLTVHPMYNIMLCPYTNWEKYMEWMRKHDPKHFRRILVWNNRYLIHPEQENFSTARQVADIVERNYDKQLIKDLKKYTKLFYDKKTQRIKKEIK